VTVEQLETARDHVEVATVQNRYNVAHRDDEDVLQACEEYDIGFIPWYPLAAGNLGALAFDRSAGHAARSSVDRMSATRSGS